jgi:hypothetical protein
VGGNLQVRLNGELLSVTPLSDAPSGTASLQRLQFSAPTDQIGLVPVSIRYTVPMRSWDGQSSLSLGIPLVVPGDEVGYQFAGQHIAFTLGDAMQIEPDPTGVDEFSRPTPQPTNSSEQAFSWSKAAPNTRWTVRASSTGPSDSLHIGLAWVQTWLSEDRRHERVAFRVSTMQETLGVRLPAGVDPTRTMAAINAREIAVQPRDPGRVRIDLPAAARGRDFVLELWYSLEVSGSRTGWRSERLQPAEIEGGGFPRRMYWQLLLPEDEHLVSLPADLAPEMAWSAENWFLARRPTLDQRQLEGLLGASRQALLPRGANEYLFGGLGRSPRLSVIAFHRRFLLALASGGVLLLGLALVHVPPLRHPLVLFVLAVGLAGLALAFPDLALLAGQMALLGVLVALAGAIWAWLGFGRTLWADPSPSQVTTRPRETASTHSPLRKPERGSPLSTATAPAALAGTAAEARQ